MIVETNRALGARSRNTEAHRDWRMKRKQEPLRVTPFSGPCPFTGSRRPGALSQSEDLVEPTSLLCYWPCNSGRLLDHITTTRLLLARRPHVDLDGMQAADQALIDILPSSSYHRLLPVFAIEAERNMVVWQTSTRMRQPPILI